MHNVTVQPFTLVGISVRTTNENDQSGEDIAQLWQRFQTEGLLEKIPNRVDDTIYSLYTDYEKDHTKPYTAILGCAVSDVADVPDIFTVREFQGGKYVKLSATGDLTNQLIMHQWLKIWDMDLQRTFTADFETFGEEAKDPKNATVQFYVAIQ